MMYRQQLPCALRLARLILPLPFYCCSPVRSTTPAAGGMIAASSLRAFLPGWSVRFARLCPTHLTFLSPLLVLIIGAFALMLVIQPVGAWLTTAIFSVLTFIFEKLGVLGGYILSAGFLPLVSVGRIRRSRRSTLCSTILTALPRVSITRFPSL